MWKFWKKVILSVLVLVIAFLLGCFIYKSEPRLNIDFENEKPFLKNHPFHLGLDLSGGSHLIYKADISGVSEGEIGDSMSALRDVIERRVNLFGVSEPIVQVQGSSFISGGTEELIVDLPGVTDVDEAVAMIGKTPLLEFKVQDLTIINENSIDESGNVNLNPEDFFVSTELTGRYLKKAALQFDPNTREPIVSLQFDDTGKELFAEITKENVGNIVAIYLDGAPISTPVVREEILNGEAIISGDFDPNEAKQLVGRLNSGALPVPISLLSKQKIGAVLGEGAINAGVKAAIIGFLIIALFLILLYRLPGLFAVISLSIFVVIILSLFKLIPVTITAAGIAGFIISMGIAVDANILTFERIKEELRSGKSVASSILAGFERSWYSIRDSNISGLITSFILFWFGTSLIKGFALTLGLGILVSLFTSVVITRLFLRLFIFTKDNKFIRFLFSSGLSSGKVKNN